MSKPITYLTDINGKKCPFYRHTVSDMDLDYLRSCKSIYDYKRNERIADVIMGFDIETTTYSRDLAFMYVWQFDILYNNYHYVIVGRTWPEWQLLIKTISQVLNGRRHVIFVHNLGFEYQFFRNFITQNHNVFAVKSRMPLKVKDEDLNTEYRCSWKLTNMSLEMACKREEGVRFHKEEEKIDYREIRFPDTVLSEKHWRYNVADVVCLTDLIYNINRNNGDNLATMPLTSTGYVRRDCKRRIKKEMPKYRQEVFDKIPLSEDAYTILKEAGRGGNTHANRFFVSEVL